MQIFLFMIVFAIYGNAAGVLRSHETSAPVPTETSRRKAQKLRTKARDKGLATTRGASAQFLAMLLRKMKALDTIRRNSDLSELEREDAVEKVTRDFLLEEITLRKNDLAERSLNQTAISNRPIKESR